MEDRGTGREKEEVLATFSGRKKNSRSQRQEVIRTGNEGEAGKERKPVRLLARSPLASNVTSKCYPNYTR